MEITYVHAQPGTGLSPPSPWQLPPPTSSSPCKTHNSVIIRGRGVCERSSSGVCVCSVCVSGEADRPTASRGGLHPCPLITSAQAHPQPATLRSQGTVPIELDATSPLPSSLSGDPSCREARNTPPTSGYPFGSDPRPGLSQTVPCPTTPHPRTPPGTSHSTRSPSVQQELGGNLFPSPSLASREAHKRWENLVTGSWAFPSRTGLAESERGSCGCV